MKAHVKTVFDSMEKIQIDNRVVIEILYEDEHIIAFIKPPGILSQGSDTNESNMISYLNKYFNNKCTAYPVHRLDRSTGGVMIAAKSSKSAAELAKIITDGKMYKEYLAVVHGIPEIKSGLLEDYIYFDRKKDKSFIAQSIRRGVKKASLNYTTEESAEYGSVSVSLLRIILHTGRTHQIRVQMAGLGHPLLGDGKYGGRDNKCKSALWSRLISFELSGNKIRFEASPSDAYPWNLFSNTEFSNQI